MAYSVIDIVNLALGRIGQIKIDLLTEDSTAAIQASLAWPYVRDEVLSATDWVFAKTRTALAKNSVSPVQGFLYAYTLPADFLRVCRNRENDPPVYPPGVTGTNYVIESLADGTLCLFTDYDNTDSDIIVQYIRRETNPTRYSPSFISAAAYRLGGELAIILPESGTKLKDMMTLYSRSLRLAEGINSVNDHVKNENGNTGWVDAGR